MKTFALSLLALSLASVALADDRVFLSRTELEGIAQDKTWNMVRAADGHNVQWNLSSGGRLNARNLSAGSSDAGRWSLNDSGQLCVKWRGSSIDRCVAVFKEGEALKLADSADVATTYATLKVD